MADTATAPAAPAPAAGDKAKPPKPDQEAYEKELKRLEDAHNGVMAKFVRLAYPFHGLQAFAGGPRDRESTSVSVEAWETC